jgi:hypothetical protein
MGFLKIMLNSLMPSQTGENDSSVTSPTRRKPPGRKTRQEKGDLRFGKTAITNGNGTGFLPGVDGRLLVARRFKDISSAMLADPGAQSQLQLIRGFAAAASLAEMVQAKLTAGEEISPEMAVAISKHSTLLSTMVRIASRLDIKRRGNDTPNVNEYLAALEAKDAAVEHSEGFDDGDDHG